MRYFVCFLFVAALCCRERPVDQGKLLGSDYRLFQGSPAWELAKAARLNDTAQMEQIVRDDTLGLNYQEPKYGETLLMLTVMNHQYTAFKKFIELGADISIHDNYDGTSAIIQASDIHVKDSRFLEVLLANGANPNDLEIGERRPENLTRDTPLLNASKTELRKVIALVEAGADINYETEFGETALSRSIFQDKLDIALYLLERGANYTIPVLSRQGKDIFVLDILRELLYPLDTEEYLQKLKIIQFLERKGLNYYDAPIPDFIVDEVKRRYPVGWEDYLKKY